MRELWEFFVSYQFEIILVGVFVGIFGLFSLSSIWSSYQTELQTSGHLLMTVSMALVCGYTAIYTPYELSELEKGWVHTNAEILRIRWYERERSPGTVIYRYEVPSAKGFSQIYYGSGSNRYGNHRHGGKKISSMLKVTLQFPTQAGSLTQSGGMIGVVWNS